MKFFLIIPMGGKGKRFVKSGYKTYKTFLPIDKKKGCYWKKSGSSDINWSNNSKDIKVSE